MLVDQNIVLVGFMGTGKSSVGRDVARRLGRHFIDLDDEIVLAAGRPIPRIFEDEGESGFRRWERQVVKRFSVPKTMVLATGGGIVLDVGNTEALSKGGILICLDATVESILSRVGRDQRRPLLQTPDREQRIRELMDERRASYEAIPLHVSTDGRSRTDVVNEVITKAEQACD